MGVGQIDPGLIYDATAQDYVNLLCSTNYTKNQIRTITRSGYACTDPNPDLNYPSFLTLYDENTKNGVVQEFKRTVTNVGGVETSYEVRLKAPRGSKVTVSPAVLRFGKKYEKQSYSLRIAYAGNTSGVVEAGEIVWIEENGVHKVRSPIVVAPMIPVW